MADGKPKAGQHRTRGLHDDMIGSKPGIDDAVRLAAALCRTPMATLSVIDEADERFISCHGCAFTELPSRGGLAEHVISTQAPLRIPDVRADSRFKSAPLAGTDKSVRFYAAVPLPLPQVGITATLGAMDTKPHGQPDETLHVLGKLAEYIARQFTLPEAAHAPREQRQDDTSDASKVDAARTYDIMRMNEHLRFAQRVANIGSWEYNVADGTRTWSDEIYRILGIDRESMPESADTVSAVVHPDDRLLLDEARKRAIAGEENPEFEHRIVRPGGEIRYVRERAQLLKDADGNPVRLFGTVQDITEKKQTQLQLERNERLLRIAGRMAKLGAWQLDVDEQRIDWSEEVCEIHELSPCPTIAFDDALGYVAPEWREHVRRFIDACTDSGKSYDEEFEIITARGRRAWVRTIGQPVFDSHGRVACIQGALQDITQEKKSEAAVKRLAARLASTLENISDAFITLDADWNVTYMNKQAERLMETDRDRLLGHNIWDVYGEEVGGTFYKNYHLAVQENRTVSFEEYSPHIDRWLDVTAYPSQDGLAVYFRDATARRNAEIARRESEERTRLIVETAMDAVISIDRDSVITGWNRQAETIFGWPEQEAVGRYLYELIIPERYRDAHRRGVQRFLKTGKGPLLNRRAEVCGLKKNGCEIPVELSISPIRSGKTYSFSAFIRDITERKKTESAIRESEERFRVVAKATADTVWDWNFASDSIWWNDGIQTVFGYGPDEVAPDSNFWFRNIHPDDLEDVVTGIQKVRNGEADEWTGEYRFRRRNGSYAHVIDRGFAIRDYTGEPIRMVGGMNDITERKEYENKVAEQAALLDKAQDAIIVRDVDDRITYWNMGAERLYGWHADEVVGQFMDELLRPDPARFQEATRQVFGKNEWTGEITKRHKNGKTVTVEGAWTLVRDEQGRPKCILTIDTDISERIALEEQLRQSQRLEAIGQLTGGVAHDFNNLLTIILGNAELMEEQLERGDRLYKLAEMTRNAARRGADLTHRLLAFARRQALEPTGVEVDQLIHGMEGLLRRTLLENIELEIVRNEKTQWRAYVDPSQLEAVILNLCINAKDAMPGSGKLVIETGNARLDEDYASQNVDITPGRYVMVAVSDTGTGIAPENIGRVFDPFFTTKETGKGTGLGLSMAYGFAKQSHGHIKVYSEPDQGTTVKLYLPVADHAETAPSVSRPDVRHLSGTETILVVEDDDLVREHAKNQLADFGYDVITARNGSEAIEIVKRKEDIDLLFTDVIMSGGMNGRELAETAKRIRPRLKVLYTSGYTENAIVHHGRLDQGVNLLQKPYQRADLAKKVRFALGSSPSVGGNGTPA